MTAIKNHLKILCCICCLLIPFVIQGQDSTNSVIPDGYWEEDVFVGYGSVKKSELTGAVIKINTEALENLPASRMDQLLQGRAAGVFVSSVDGAPGAATSIRIRGDNSVKGNNESIYVIDGFIAGKNFDLNHININNIASVEVLKGTSVASIYGSRGTNGVILITTKSGSDMAAGENDISVKYYGGIQTFSRPIDLLNGREFAIYANEEAASHGGVPSFHDVNAVADTDWQEEISGVAPIHNLDLSMQGNTGKLNYFLAANYFKQQGIIKESGIDKYIFRVNVDGKITKRLTAGMRANFSILRYQNSTVDLDAVISESYPVASVYDKNGEFTSVDPLNGTLFYNPVANIALRDDNSIASNLLSNIYLEYQPIKGLIIRSSLSWLSNRHENNAFESAELYGRRETEKRLSMERHDLLHENTISYEKQFSGQHRMSVLGGFTWQNGIDESDEINYVNYNIDGALGEEEPAKPFSRRSESKLKSWLGRFNYSFKDKYFLTMAIRSDRSSYMAKNSNLFPSVALAWSMGQEPFLRNSSVIDFLKIRSSYGTGNSLDIGSYISFYAAEISASGNAVLTSPELDWETNKGFDIGLDAGFFNGRLNMIVDYYYKRTEDVLHQVPIPTNSGYIFGLSNLGSLQNRGLELMLNTVNLVKNDFQWKTTVALGGNRNKITDLGEFDRLTVYSARNDLTAIATEGEPLGVFYGLKYLGIWKSQEEIDESGNDTVEQGDLRFIDYNADGKINTDDRKVLGRPEPEFYGGINNTFSYKNFTLDIYFQGVYGNDNLNELSFYGYTGYNDLQMIRDRWSPDNPDAYLPRLGAPFEDRASSTMIQDGSFLRLKNIRFTYNHAMKKTGIVDGLSLFLSGSNLLVLTNFSGFDPEAGGSIRGAEYPRARIVTAGVSFKFN